MSGHNLAAWVNKTVGLVVLSLLATGLCAAPAIAQESGTSTRIGNFELHDFSSGVSGTSTRIGNFEFHDFNNGVSGTSTRIGNSKFHNFSDGTNCTTTQIRRYSYTNCY